MENAKITGTEYSTIPFLAKQLGIKYHALLRAANSSLVPA